MGAAVDCAGDAGSEQMRRGTARFLARALKQPVQQLRGGQDQGGGIGDPFARDIRRGAMHRLRHRVGRARVQRSAQSHAAGETGGLIGQDIAEQIGRRDQAELLVPRREVRRFRRSNHGLGR